MFQYSVLLFLTVVLFLYGFFPISNNTTKFGNEPPTQIGNLTINLTETYGSHFTKTVVIVIDALRLDFVTRDLMPRTVELMNKKGCLSKVHVESPTVTLPRIKALTTGSITQYFDVVKNLASSEILGDSWLHSAKRKGLKTVFYGDNTWEKLFPDFFTRSEGTTSFFVWDFTEVDDNVTRNVNLELERKDWDIMILHYLGLDHIGHVLGPFSSKMPPKLSEMDGIVNKIYEETNESSTLILITGDHGMRDSGGHGGTTHPEVTVPLIAIGLNCHDSSFLQTDIPANLAVLLGLNIPSTSIGKIQQLFLSDLSLQDYLYALRYNAEILLKKNKLCTDTFVNATSFHEGFLKSKDEKYAKIALNLYQDCSTKITENLYHVSSKQDMSCLFVAIFSMVNILTMLLQHLLSSEYKTPYFKVLVCISIVLTPYFINVESISKLSILILIGLFIFELKKLIKHWTSVFKGSLNTFLILTCILHPITFISTSFIEEEHYYWIYFSVTLVLLFAIQLYVREESFSKNNIAKVLLVLIFIRFSMDLNSTLENSVQNTDNWANILIAEENYLYHQVFFNFSLISLFFTMCNNNITSKTNFMFNISCLVTLILIFILKSNSYHNTLLGKLLWILIILQKIFFRQYSWKHFWIHASALLIKPHNLILIPFAIYTGKQMCKLDHFKSTSSLTVAGYMLSNCFYFLQGHRNSLASVDISIGYIGLNDYYPILVISQVLIHTFSFQVLFHLTVLESISKVKEQKQFWLTLLTLRTSVVMFTSLMMIVFRHHLFIWSVFAPKFFMESVHTAFLFIEICFWYVYSYLKMFFIQKRNISL